MMIKNC